MELYEVFKPHIEEVLNQPTQHQKEELIAGLSHLAEAIREADNPDELKASMMFQMSLIQLLEHVDRIAVMLYGDDYGADQFQQESDSLRQEVETLQVLFKKGIRYLEIPEEDFQQVLQDFEEIQADLHERIREKNGLA